MGTAVQDLSFISYKQHLSKLLSTLNPTPQMDLASNEASF